MAKRKQFTIAWFGLERCFFQNRARTPKNSIFAVFPRSLAVPASDDQTFGLVFPPDPLSKAIVDIQSIALRSRPLAVYVNDYPLI